MENQIQKITSNGKEIKKTMEPEEDTNFTQEIKEYSDMNKSKIEDEENVKFNLTEDNKEFDIKLYKRRWIILVIFVLYAACSFLQWFQYSIISNLIQKYYGASDWDVKLTSLVFMITYLPLAFPVSYFMDRISLKTSALIGSTGTCLGSWMKVFSVHPDRFTVTFIGQTAVALAQLFIINVPPKLAAVWFGENEVSTACSIAIYGSQFGIASGFFLSPLMVQTSDDLDLVGEDLRFMFSTIAIFSTIMVILVALFFQAEPPKPPSTAQAVLRSVVSLQKSGYISSLKRLLLNPGFMYLVMSNGINNGCFSALSTLLNQIFQFYFPNGEQDPGTTGVIIVVNGMIGSVVFGVMMDRTRKYKEIAFWVYFLAAVTMIGYSYALTSPYKMDNLILAGILGFFLLGYTPVGYEFASELTYPESEATVATILNTMNMLAGIILTVIFDAVLISYGEFWSNISAAGSLFVGTGLTLMIKPKLKRQQAAKLVRGNGEYEAANVPKK